MRQRKDFAQRRERPRCDYISAAAKRRSEFLDSHMVDCGRGANVARRLAQEIGFFSIAFNQMDDGLGPVRERAGDHQAGKAGAGAKIDPGFRLGGEVEELQRVGDVPRCL